MKVSPVETASFHADGRTDRQTDRHDETNSRFPKFCERARKTREGAGDARGTHKPTTSCSYVLTA
jgi:hypothetical protein